MWLCSSRIHQMDRVLKKKDIFRCLQCSNLSQMGVRIRHTFQTEWVCVAQVCLGRLQNIVWHKTTLNKQLTDFLLQVLLGCHLHVLVQSLSIQIKIFHVFYSTNRGCMPAHTHTHRWSANCRSLQKQKNLAILPLGSLSLSGPSHSSCQKSSPCLQ